MLRIWMLLLLAFFQIKISIAYECQWTHTNELVCTGLKNGELSRDILIKIDKSEVTLLNITKTNLTKIDKAQLRDFVNLIELHVTESQLGVIENDTFKNNLKLVTLNLSDNYLEDFQSAAFSPKNRLDTIDLSKNVLTNLSNFNVSNFPRLKMLILDGNGLEYLPKNVIEKLQENNNFYLSVERNPWDCQHPEWKEYLDADLIQALCGGEKFVYKPKVRGKRNVSESDYGLVCLDVVNEKSVQNSSSGNDIRTCLNCSFYYCIFWFVGGIWIGIIVGNIFKIKNLLFSGPKKSFTDVGIQCEYAYLEQLRMSDLKYSKHFQKKFPNPKSSRISIVKESSKDTDPNPPNSEDEPK